jgi:electron-transferring-flavoprotein dehydrogenase
MIDPADGAGVERQSMDVDIACVGFGPATAGFLAALSQHLLNADGTPAIESRVIPGMPLQVVCYERADDVGFGVSGVVTRARGIRATLPSLDFTQIPMAGPVTSERVAYLLDPVGASRRPLPMRIADRLVETLGLHNHFGIELPYVPPFLRKHGGFVLSMGQFMQHMAADISSSGVVQIWPGMPVAEALTSEDNGSVIGIRLCDQGLERDGTPQSGFTPGMDIHADLTVVGDGPVGAVGRQLNERFGLPQGHHQREWALGMKMVVDLPAGTPLQAGTVFHTIGYPEPEIFGFLYVHPNNAATVGIFVPSWFRSPMRTSYRYLQHYMQHPYLWRYLAGGTLRSWGAKSLQESGRRGEPLLVGDGYARIGEGSGSTNILAGSGVDEAWTTGAQLAQAVLELAREAKPFTRENLERTYLARRRASWLDQEGRIAEKSRDGFHRGLIPGLVGMALAGFSGGRFSLAGEPRQMPSPEDFYASRIPKDEFRRIVDECRAMGLSCHDELMDACGWPEIPFDGKLLVTHQDALLIGGKVQAPAGYADHIAFLNGDFCEACLSKQCIEMCSGQAIAAGPGGVPVFDREKCIYCGACVWNCPAPVADNSPRSNIAFRAGAGGLHSTEN